jgi:Mitochondrial F1-F0 ATP synthase subunit F of fungi
MVPTPAQAQTWVNHLWSFNEQLLSNVPAHFGGGVYIDPDQGLGAAKDAVRMARIAKFYERLPKGPMPEIKPRGLLERYQHRYFGKNPSAAR